jgi:hypothetical protein
MNQFFYVLLAVLLLVLLISIGCNENSEMLAPDSEQDLQSVAKKTAEGENLLLNPEFRAPSPTVLIHQVENGIDCAPEGSEGLYWTEWLTSPEFTDVRNEDFFNLITCDGVPWISYGDPVSILGWKYSTLADDRLTYRSYFDYYTPSNQVVDLGKENRLWQEIDNHRGAVIYHIEYAWAATFGFAGKATVSFNQEILATHNASDYVCSSPGSSNCYSNYNQWADDWDFGGDPYGNTHGFQIEKYTVIVPSGNTTVTIAFESDSDSAVRSDFAYLGILVDRVSVSAPDKVKICHLTGNNGKWQTIEIANNQSVLAHLDHGDHLYSSESCNGVH